MTRRWSQALRLPATGYLVTDVAEGSAADTAGLRGASREVIVGNYRIPWGGDVIVGVDDVAITDKGKMQEALSLKLAGDAVTLQVLRDGEELELVVTLRGRNAGVRL